MLRLGGGAEVMRGLDLQRRPSLAVVVADRMREAIIDGELALGEALSEDKLAVSLGVSRTPVREALTALQLQGLINILPQRGSYVFQPAEQDVAELCEFRAMIEIRALSLAHARDRNAALRGMQEAQSEMEASEKAEDTRRSARADAAFHEALFANCGNRFLLESYGLVSGRIGALRSYLLSPHAGIRMGSIREHREIIEAFMASDLLRAEAVLATHVLKMRERYAAASQGGAPDVPSQ
jgi:DNA-binding GntR family transcriptional regulator